MNLTSTLLIALGFLALANVAQAAVNYYCRMGIKARCAVDLFRRPILIALYQESVWRLCAAIHLSCWKL